MKILTSKLEGAALDWAVAKCKDTDPEWDGFSTHKGEVWSNARKYSPSTDWSQGGPIIERERITLHYGAAGIWRHAPGGGEFKYKRHGPTPLIAAMRCYVASKLGNEVDVPAELL